MNRMRQDIRIAVLCIEFIGQFLAYVPKFLGIPHLWSFYQATQIIFSQTIKYPVPWYYRENLFNLHQLILNPLYLVLWFSVGKLGTPFLILRKSNFLRSLKIRFRRTKTQLCRYLRIQTVFSQNCSIFWRISIYLAEVSVRISACISTWISAWISVKLRMSVSNYPHNQGYPQ